MVFVLKAVFF